MGQKGGQNGSKILPKRRSYPKWVKKEVKKGQRSTGVVNDILNVKVLLLTVPIVVMLLVLNTTTVFGPYSLTITLGNSKNEKFKKLVPEAEPGPRTPDSPYPLGSTINSQTPCTGSGPYKHEKFSS